MSKSATRRKFLAGAAVTGAAAVAMPQVSRAQTVTWKYQSTWPTKDIFHEFAVDYAKKVNDMSGGRLKLDVLAAGAVVPAFQMQDAVHSGVLDAGHGVTAYWYGKHKASSLFGTPPSLGWDAHGMLGWFYYGGGEALYNELVNDILKLNLVGFLYFPMPTQPLGWFKKAVKSADDFKGIKYRTVGLSADLFKEMGAAVTILAGRRNRAGAWTAACSTPRSSTIRPPTSCSASRTSPRSSCWAATISRQESFEIIFNKAQVQRAAGGAQGDPAIRRLRGLGRPVRHGA